MARDHLPEHIRIIDAWFWIVRFAGRVDIAQMRFRCSQSMEPVEQRQAVVCVHLLFFLGHSSPPKCCAWFDRFAHIFIMAKTASPLSQTRFTGRPTGGAEGCQRRCAKKVAWDTPPTCAFRNGLPLGCSWSCGGWDWNAMTSGQCPIGLQDRHTRPKKALSVDRFQPFGRNKRSLSVKWPVRERFAPVCAKIVMSFDDVWRQRHRQPGRGGTSGQPAPIWRLTSWSAAAAKP